MRRLSAAVGTAALAVSVLAAGCGGISTTSKQAATARSSAVAASTTPHAPSTGTTVAPNPPAITLNEFGSIEYGMILDQVVATFGSPGTVHRVTDSDSSETRWWDGPPGSDGYAMLVFRDGVVFGKTQVGLS
jgi:hypothetical protein